MKKKLFGIVALICCMVMGLSLFAACGTDWSNNVTLKPTGTVSSNGGFVVEMGDYLVYINGIESYTADNTFGKPVKGAIVVAKKDLSEKEVLVPKIAVSGDYNSGICVFGDYVYYATPSNRVNTSGETVNTDLVLARTSLDGKTTEELVTLSSNSAKYRFVENGGNVYAYYVEGGALSVYSVTDKKATDIVEEDFGSYTFLSAKETEATGYVIVYTQDVEDETRKDATMDYNEIYGVKAGATEATLLVSGKAADGDKLDKSLTISLIRADKYLVYQAKATSSETKYYACDLTDGAKTEIVNTAYVSNGIASSLTEVVYTSSNIVYKVSLLDKNEPAPYLYVKDISTIIGIENGYLYYINTSNYVSKIAMTEE